ncbi:MAG TPA: hypothetical protein VF207_07470, partial [Chthoniobacterales bacterium]
MMFFTESQYLLLWQKQNCRPVRGLGSRFCLLMPHQSFLVLVVVLVLEVIVSPFTVRRSPFAVPPFAVRRSPFAVRRSP